MAPRPATLRALVIVTAWGLVWAKALGLMPLVNPTYLDWMVDGDWMAHLFGWLFTRNGPWALPLAQAPDLIAPYGSSAAFTDAIPLLSVIGKVLSPFFGDRMQLFGVWMVACIIGSGVAGVLVCRAWFKDTASLALIGCLFVMNPIASLRYGHPSLMAFWLILGLVGACVWPVLDVKRARRLALATLALGFTGCAVHPYVAVMCSALVAASLLRLALTRVLPVKESVGWFLAGPAVCLGSLWLFGFVAGASSGGTLGAEGFGQFSADLLTFVNPSMWSRFIGPLPMQGRQYEGSAYLGLGVLALLVLRVGLLFRHRPTRKDALLLLPLVVAALLMAAFAASNVITIGGKPIADLTDFYAKLAPLPAVFRSSGRFIWPLAACLMFAAVLGTSGIEVRWVRQFVLGGAVLLQVADFDVTRSGLHRPYAPFVPFRDPVWQLMSQGYKHVVVNPVQLQWVCPFDGPYIARLSWEAYRQHLSINSGHVGRPPPGTDCRHQLTPAELDRETIYVPYFPEFAHAVSSSLVCAQVEGRPLCVLKGYDTPLLRALLARAEPR